MGSDSVIPFLLILGVMQFGNAQLFDVASLKQQAIISPPHTSSGRKSDMALVNKVWYAPEMTLRNYTNAMKYCEEQGGEIAKITSQNLVLWMRYTLPDGFYWVDGIYSGSLEAFTLQNKCTRGSWSTTSPPLSDAKNNLCLVFVRTTSLKTSILQPTDCGRSYRAICAMPEDGCKG